MSSWCVSRELGGSNERPRGQQWRHWSQWSEVVRNSKGTLRKRGRMKIRHAPGGVPWNQSTVDSGLLYGYIYYYIGTVT